MIHITVTLILQSSLSTDLYISNASFLSGDGQINLSNVPLSILLLLLYLPNSGLLTPASSSSYGTSEVASSNSGDNGSRSKRRDIKVARSVSEVVLHHWSRWGTYMMLGRLRRASWKTCMEWISTNILLRLVYTRKLKWTFLRLLGHISNKNSTLFNVYVIPCCKLSKYYILYQATA